MAASNFFVQSATINHTGIFSSLLSQTERHKAKPSTSIAISHSHLHSQCPCRRAYAPLHDMAHMRAYCERRWERSERTDRDGMEGNNSNSNIRSNEKKWFTSAGNALLPIARRCCRLNVSLVSPEAAKRKYRYVFLAPASTHTHRGTGKLS